MINISYTVKDIRYIYIYIHQCVQGCKQETRIKCNLLHREILRIQPEVELSEVIPFKITRIGFRGEIDRTKIQIVWQKMKNQLNSSKKFPIRSQ